MVDRGQRVGESPASSALPRTARIADENSWWHQLRDPETCSEEAPASSRNSRTVAAGGLDCGRWADPAEADGRRSDPDRRYATPHGDELPQQVFNEQLYEIYSRFLETDDESFDCAPAKIPPPWWAGRGGLEGGGKRSGPYRAVWQRNVGTERRKNGASAYSRCWQQPTIP